MSSDLVDSAAPARRPRLRLRRASGALAIAAALLAALWVAGLVWFAGKAAGAPRPGPARTDAIVVLTGGSERIATGLTLLAQRRADQLFISGVETGVALDELLVLAERTPGVLDHRITVGYRAADTLGNAEEAAGWMRARGFRSLRLVTPNYHMPRSLLAFRRLLPDIAIHPHPVQPETVHLDDWWLWPGTTRLLISEYHKYLASWLRFALSADAAPVV